MMHISGLGSRIEPGVFATGCASPELQVEPRTGLSAFSPKVRIFHFPPELLTLLLLDI